VYRWTSGFQRVHPPNKSLHSTFGQFRRKNYVTSIRYNFWFHQSYKVQIHVIVSEFQFPLRIVFSVIKELINNNLKCNFLVCDFNVRIFLPSPSQAHTTLDKNSSLPLLSRNQLLPICHYSRDNLVTVSKENFGLLAPAITTLLSSLLTPRHPRDTEGVRRNFSESVQEHGEVEPQCETRGSHRSTAQRQGATQLQVT
jgi:hypothetical protein